MVVGETIAERYELEEVVGHGGMSTVYKAHDSLLERYVALKVLHQQYNEDEDFVERFKREARSVAQLQHPNIVTVIDRGEEDGRQYIVFEFIDGENLKELVVRKGRLDVRDALEIALEIARGLAFAHENGLVHRDVKPQNVLLNGDGRAKVTDFGIARSLDVEHGVTQTGTDPRNVELHRSGAGEWATGRRTHGRLLARDRPVRDDHRRACRSPARASSRLR